MFKSGTASISNGATGYSLTFGSAFSTAPILTATVEYSGTGDYLLVFPTLSAKSTTGCFFEFNAAVDSSAYILNWMAADSLNITGATGGTGPIGSTGPTGATFAAATPSKPINRLAVASSVAGGNYIPVFSTSGGVATTTRISLDTLKTFVNS